MCRLSKRLFALICALLILISLFSCSLTAGFENNGLSVHFIDVGQGDSILIICENQAMLIDAGDNNKGETVLEYIQTLGIDKLNYVIATHPHSDHIGGLDTVLKSMETQTIIMPEVANTTKTFEDFLDVILEKDIYTQKPVVGKSYSLGSSTFTILAPNSSSYNDLNNYSVCIKLTYKNRSFLFTGDASGASEKEMLENRIDISADVIKIGHHGSDTSTNEQFLTAVNPSYAVISVGADNSYGHPSKAVLSRLKRITVYRTDINGTVIAECDGENIKFICKKS